MKKVRILSIAIPLFMLTLYPFIADAQRASSRLKDEEQALKQAIMNTVFPILLGYGTSQLFDNRTIQVSGATLAIYGAVMGPSYGNFYANDYVRGLSGVAARVAGAILLKNATSEVMGNDISDELGWDKKDVAFSDNKIWIGTTLMAGSALYNIITARTSAREFNQRLGVITHVRQDPVTGKIIPSITMRFNF